MTEATKTRSQQVATDIVAHLRSRAPLLWIITREEVRVEGYLFEAAAAAGYTTVTWDSAQGVRNVDGSEADVGDQDIGATLNAIRTQAESAAKAPRLWILRDLHAWLAPGLGIQTIRQIRNLCRALPGTPLSSAQAMIVLTPSTQVPEELAGHAVVIDWPMPDRTEIASILDTALDALPEEQAARVRAKLVNGTREAAIDAAVGLSGEEVDSCYARSLVTKKTIDAATISKDKKKVIARERVLEWIDPIPGGLDAVGGLEPLKAWLKQRQGAYSPKARAYGLPTPKGILAVGYPGCGKSLFAKATASGWGVPLLKMDLGVIKSKFVGESEANLRRAFRTVDAIGRCVLWFDEVEKQLGGATQGAADGGVSADALGALLGWMQDRTNQAFIIATANSVDGLPPELLRKGRWDEQFFVDLPTLAERAAVLRAALAAHGRGGLKIDVDAIARETPDFTGAELASLVPDALYVGFAEGEREITGDDLMSAARTIRDSIMVKTQPEKVAKLRESAKSGWRRANAVEDLQVLAKGGRRIAM